MGIAISRKSRQDLGTAFHEAGHAVVSWREAVPFKRVSIIPEADSLGHILLRRMPGWCNWDSDQYQPERARRWFEKRVRINLAGFIAEKKHLGRRPKFGSGADFEYVLGHALEVCGSADAASAWIRWLWIETEQVLEENWASTEELAIALLDRKTISGDEAFEIIREGGRTVK